jgi:gamma-glutamyltranspeptidase/glutathione hydrolase
MRVAVAVALTMLVAACAGRPPPGAADLRRDFRGGVVGDEPRAVLAGKEVLLRGGTAADAAVTMYFGHAVTLPSRASLGGGGVCMVWEPKTNKAEALLFPARGPAGADGARAIAIPGNTRGMVVLHAKYGRLRWEQLVAPAETMARFGIPVSRALADDLAEAGQGLAADPEGNLIFIGTDKLPLREGTVFVQPDLANVLGAIRNAGGLSFYSGVSATRFVAAAQAAGAGFSAEELTATAPIWRETIQVQRDAPFRIFGLTDLVAHVPPTLGGMTEAQIFAMLAAGRRIRGTSVEERPHLVAEASLRAALDRQQWSGPDGTIRLAPVEIVGSRRIEVLMASYRPNQRTAVGASGALRASDPHAASFAAIDRTGQAVACEVTANGPFGAAKVAPGTGIVLAAAPEAGDAGPQSLGPMLVLGSRLGPIFFAGTASGGSAAAPALAVVAAQTLIEERSLEQALDTPRVFHDGSDDVVVVEAGIGESLPGLAARGYSTRPSAKVGRVNAILCPDGLPAETPNCQFRADHRGAGFAVVAQ